MFESVTVTVRRPERFIQLATGWLLRELRTAPRTLPRVVKFIEANIASFSAEGLRYAVEKMSNEEKTRLVGLRRDELGLSDGEKGRRKTKRRHGSSIDEGEKRERKRQRKLEKVDD